MSWDQKRKRKYYYRSVRAGSQVKKIYFGRGKDAQRAYQEDINRRQNQVREQKRWLELLDDIDSRRRLTSYLLDMTDLVFKAVMILHGFYLHKGHEWRRRKKESK